jgi:hypothetical protein
MTATKRTKPEDEPLAHVAITTSVSTSSAPLTSPSKETSPTGGQDHIVKKQKVETTVVESTLDPIVIWFRSDLRIHDNTAFFTAAQLASASKRPLVALFVISPGEWLEHDLSPIRVYFLLRSLEILKTALQGLNVPLIVRRAETRRDVPQVVSEVVRTVRAKEVYCNKEYEVNEGLRDKKVERLLSECMLSQFKLSQFKLCLTTHSY